MRLNIIYNMRLVSVIVLLGICLSIFSSIVVQPVHSVTQEDSIMTLNVCNNHGSVLNNADMPFISECPCKLSVISFSGFYNVLRPSLNLPLMALQRDYPPEI
ncbi:MAG: hypothetical protein ACK415_05795 [Thermodesulfovibrionales bacterium]